MTIISVKILLASLISTDTTAKTQHVVVKYLLLCCNFLCHFRPMMGYQLCKEKERTCNPHQNDVPAALPVHCLAHSLNLCLQDAARQIELLRDAIDVRETSKALS